jgi:hypothetical protein
MAFIVDVVELQVAFLVRQSKWLGWAGGLCPYSPPLIGVLGVLITWNDIMHIRATQGASDFGDEDNDAGDLARTTANNQKRLESMIVRE